MAIRLPRIPANPSNDYLTNFSIPSAGGYNTTLDPWDFKKIINPSQSYGMQPSDIPISSIAEPIAQSMDNLTTMNAFNDPGYGDSSTPELPYVPPVESLDMIYDVAALGLNLLGGFQKADAQRAEAEAKQKYYNDLATYKEKLTNAAAYQMSLKSVELGTQEKQLSAAQSATAAAAGFSGQSLTDIQTSDAMSFQIDKELIKRASQQALNTGYDEAAQYRRAGSGAMAAGNITADSTLTSTITGVGLKILGK